MLKQILKAGCIDPELLEMLTEEQKDLVFQKLREEQVRKWNEREAMIAESNPSANEKKRTPKIKFNMAADGNPWVWVMGDHKNDLSYEEMIVKREKEEEEQEKQRLRTEAEELAKHETRDILLAPVAKLETNPGKLARTESVMDNESGISASKSMKLWQKAISNKTDLIRRMSASERQDYEKRRADELYDNMLSGAQIKKQRMADVFTNYMKQWKASEEAAKEYEQRRRRASMKMKQRKIDNSLVDQVLEKSLPEEKKEAIKKKMSEHVVKRAEIHSSSPSLATGGGRVKKLAAAHFKKLHHQASFNDVLVDPDTRPKSMEHAIKWYQRYEQPKGVGIDIDGTYSLWFHGTISKVEAEQILMPKPPGMFLLRLSSKIWGYSVSVRTSEKVKHYVVLATEGKYRFVGNNQPEFNTLNDLLKYYKFNPITWSGQEVLLLPCAQTNEQLQSISELLGSEESSAM